MGRLSQVVLASSNAGKLNELARLLAALRIELIAQSTLGVEDADETAPTFIENALLKARHAAASTSLPALADDSGIVVAALDGAPGIRSARYAGHHGDDAANNRKLLARLDGADDRSAHFYCALALVRHAADPAPIIATGAWYGTIGFAPRGAQGFGYDPLFVPHGGGLTAAELSPAQKNRISHRARATANLLDQVRVANDA
ncbi:MAG: RdgB/HAM1 family non-canonical purine NTP pyrophosphatase [Gammaproteobacteria bacterium]|nr:RdgB/HAM1 family non-canonical purine NTP pyrophosphatase [Gammaproteobacteria bacterium]